MERVSYTSRICSDEKKINSFLTQKRVGVLGMCDRDGKPYSIPINYIYEKGKIYIHGMGSGKKNSILKEKSSVCFTVFEELGTVKDSIPCKCDTSYFSVVIFGKAVLLEDIEEKARILTLIAEKFVPGFFKNPLSKEFVSKYRSSRDNNTTAVYCISPEVVTAKENPMDINNMV